MCVDVAESVDVVCIDTDGWYGDPTDGAVGGNEAKADGVWTIEAGDGNRLASRPASDGDIVIGCPVIAIEACGVRPPRECTWSTERRSIESLRRWDVANE